MAQPRVRLLGKCVIETKNGKLQALDGYAAIVLTRFALARGKRLTVDELFQEVWREKGAGRDADDTRKSVQRRVMEIRALLTPGSVRMERGSVTTYRWDLGLDEIDIYVFLDLVAAAQASAAEPAVACDLYERALELWRDRPLLDAHGYQFAQKMIVDLEEKHREARRELAQCYHQLGRTAEALALVESALALDPDDGELIELARAWRPPRSGARPPAAPPQAQAAKTPRQMADDLADAVALQWSEELSTRRLRETNPLELSWRAADPELMEENPPGLAGSGKGLHDVFSSRVPGKRLVVLGGLGAGKSMLLAGLMEDLLYRRQSGDRVPAMLSLTSWNAGADDFHDWLSRQLILNYPGLGTPAPSKVATTTWARALISAGLILPVLDGLDEMRDGLRQEAIRKINHAMSQRDGLVLACRTDAYGRAVRGGGGYAVKLKGAAGIELSDVDALAAAEYLRADDDSAGRWDPVIDELGNQTALGRALRTPLMISLARAGFPPGSQRVAADLADPLIFPTEHHIQHALFDEFLRNAYRHKNNRASRSWSEPKARTALEFLARHLDEIETTEWHWWQLHRATPRGLVATVVAVICGLGVALAVGLARPLTASLGGETNKHVGLGPGFGILIALGLVVLLRRAFRQADATKPRPASGRLDGSKPAVGLAAGLAGGLVGGLAAGVANLFGVGKATWPAGGIGGGLAVGAAVGPVAGLVGGLLGGVLGGAAAGLTTSVGSGLGAGIVDGTGVGLAAAAAISLVGQREPASEPKWSAAGAVSGAAVGLAVGLATALVAGPGLGAVVATAVGAVIGWVTGLGGTADRPSEPATPAASLRHDAGAFASYWAAGTASGGLIGLLADGLDAIRANDFSAQLTALAANGLAVGLAAGVASGVILGAMHSAWPWFAIPRLWLSVRGHLPWRLMDFLADARERGILRQLGPAYQFRHAQLQEYLSRLSG